MEHVQGDTGICHPGRAGAAQAVPGEVVEPELGHEAVPVGRVANGGGGEDAAARPAQERIVRLLAAREAFEDGFERVEHGDGAVSASRAITVLTMLWTYTRGDVEQARQLAEFAGSQPAAEVNDLLAARLRALTGDAETSRVLAALEDDPAPGPAGTVV